MEIRKNLIHESSEGLTCVSPSRTCQEFKEECDVNNILRNYVSTGILTHVSEEPPQFGDFSDMPSDYGEALALIRKSEEEFMKLPSEVRERFDNKPAGLIKFIQDESNYDEAVKLGLINKPDKADQKEE